MSTLLKTLRQVIARVVWSGMPIIDHEFLSTCGLAGKLAAEHEQTGMLGPHDSTLAALGLPSCHFQLASSIKQC
jgi:hypothetical protein